MEQREEERRNFREPPRYSGKSVCREAPAWGGKGEKAGTTPSSRKTLNESRHMPEHWKKGVGIELKEVKQRRELFGKKN